MLRFLTAGESHGKALVAVLEGCPANLSLSAEDINRDLARRQQGYGRGPRMKIEKDKAEILSGLRKGKTIGSPIAILIPNRSTELFEKVVTVPRPGHADLAGALKFNQEDIRNVMERASARETAARVAVGAVARKFLSEFEIRVTSRILEIGGEKTNHTIQEVIKKARKSGDTLGGIFEIVASGVPVGLGSYIQWDKKLDGRLAQAVMSIQAVKGVEIGLGFSYSSSRGSEVHDEIFYSHTKGFYRRTNNAGGLEGGMSNGQSIVLRAAVKPIATLMRPLKSVDLVTKKACEALVERSDISAVEPAAVIGEAVVAFEIANAFLEKFGGDSLEEIRDNFSSYLKRINML